MPGSTSSSLLARLRGDDHDAWARLARLYGPLVYSWCRRRGLQEQDAADVTQDVFRAIVKGIEKYVHGPGSTFRGWLWTITRNKILDHHRQAQKRPDAAGGTDAQDRMMKIPESLDESEAESSPTSSLVRRALKLIQPEFTENTWQAFWRVMMEGQAVADVAKQLGLSVNAIYIAKSRVLRRLREELGEDAV
ncbi:MAG: sigma-70 family RNA polymerase sigma factor [Planctomycetes bacterium]|nr:sigma-70 family RNA polymerase sigma factor [Planctomycetota bacterium]